MEQATCVCSSWFHRDSGIIGIEVECFMRFAFGACLKMRGSHPKTSIAFLEQIIKSTNHFQCGFWKAYEFGKTILIYFIYFSIKKLNEPKFSSQKTKHILKITPCGQKYLAVFLPSINRKFRKGGPVQTKIQHRISTGIAKVILNIIMVASLKANGWNLESWES